MSNKTVAVLTAISLTVGILAVVAGGLYALETRIDAKIDRAVLPIGTDVRAIRSTLDQLLLQMGG